MASPDRDTARFMDANRLHWDERVPVHAASAFYDVDGFKAGATTLHDVEQRELGDVSGRTMLHLQCHFGLDTLSWRRAGATVTGVDFSGEAITVARRLTAETGLDARFIEANVYDPPGVLHETFDIVFASYGVLCWLPDLDRWAQVIARFLAPGGRFYMAESSNVADMLEEDEGGELRLMPDYPTGTEPVSAMGASYADADVTVTTPTYEWDHTVAEVVTALAAAGLVVQWVHEHPVLPWQQFRSMTLGADGWWRLPPPHDRLPLTFSIMAARADPGC